MFILEIYIREPRYKIEIESETITFILAQILDRGRAARQEEYPEEALGVEKCQVTTSIIFQRSMEVNFRRGTSYHELM